MNRLSFTHLLASAVILIGSVIGVAGQESDRHLGSAGPLEIFVGDKLCCAPAHVGILEEKLDREATVYYRFRNTGDKPIVGIVVTFTNGEWTRLHWAGFVRRDSALRDWVWNGFSGRSGEELKIDGDLLLFADGTTWGPDRHGRANILIDFKKGYDLAVDRVLKEGQDTPNDRIRSLLDTTFGYSGATDIPATGREIRSYRSPFAIGYDGVIRHLEQGEDTAKDIAAKVRSIPIE